MDQRLDRTRTTDMRHLRSRAVRLLWVVSVALLASSCSAQYHLKRAVKKDASIANDTIVRLDTTFLTQEKTLVDTLVVHDTIVKEIKRDGVVVRLQKIQDTIFVDAICESDTIELFKEVEVVRYIKEEKTSIFEEMNTLIRSLIALFITIVAVVVARRMFKY